MWRTSAATTLAVGAPVLQAGETARGDNLFARQERDRGPPIREAIAMRFLLLLLLAFASESASADLFPTTAHNHAASGMPPRTGRRPRRPPGDRSRAGFPRTTGS